MISLEELNPSQREAVLYGTGPLLILAGAGSGKTKTITYRMAHLILEKNVSPSSIVAVTFTNKASEEMSSRLSGLLQIKTRNKAYRKGQFPFVGTFHSLGMWFLRQHFSLLGRTSSFSIYDTSDSLSLLRDCLRSYVHAGKDKFCLKTIQARISWLKNKGIRASDFISSPYFSYENDYDMATEFLYQLYTEKLFFLNAIDFDDILFLCNELFSNNPSLKEQYQTQFSYLFIDEYQDTNKAQFSFLQSLIGPHNSLCVVGDDDQSIYSFRGAEIDHILNFPKEFPECKIISLEQNYRSTPAILSLANNVIAQNKKRFAKTLFSDQPHRQKPQLWSMINPEHEALQIVQDIVSKREQARMANKKKTIGILYRSNALAPLIEEQLNLYAIPYDLFGGQKFYEKKEIKDFMAYCFLLNNPRDELALRRVLSSPNKGIGNATLKHAEELATSKKCSLFESFFLWENRPKALSAFLQQWEQIKTLSKEHSLPNFFQNLFELLKYEEYLQKQYDNPKILQRKKRDLEILFSSSQKYASLKQETAMRLFAEKLLLQQNSRKIDSGDEEEGLHDVTLMTLHSAKGLEFDLVYFIGLEEEIIPHKKSILEGNVEEECRLCYVGLTRAREELILSYCQQRNFYGKEKKSNLTRFLSSLLEKNSSLCHKEDFSHFGFRNPEEKNSFHQNFFKNLIEKLS